MFQKVRKQITPATVMAFVALVFAITGGAFAATGSSGSGNGGSPAAKATASVTSVHAVTAKAKKKAASTRGPAGPKGATGATGATGPAGATGATGPGGPAGGPGPTGNNGEKGEKGEKGEQGTPGKNGTNGQTGFTETLPPGKTETGVWGFYGEDPGVRIPISFPIQLSQGIEASHVKFVEGKQPGEKVEGCEGGSVVKPTAEQGYLCVYVKSSLEPGASAEFVENPEGTPHGGAGTTGAILQIVGEHESVGTWAVTAPTS